MKAVYYKGSYQFTYNDRIGAHLVEGMARFFVFVDFIEETFSFCSLFFASFVGKNEVSTKTC